MIQDKKTLAVKPVIGYAIAVDKKEIAKFRGSKYLQSQIGDSFKQVKDFLTEGKKVLFSGTPCQIAGLKAYLKSDVLRFAMIVPLSKIHN